MHYEVQLEFPVVFVGNMLVKRYSFLLELVTFKFADEADVGDIVAQLQVFGVKFDEGVNHDSEQDVRHDQNEHHDEAHVLQQPKGLDALALAYREQLVTCESDALVEVIDQAEEQILAIVGWTSV